MDANELIAEFMGLEYADENGTLYSHTDWEGGEWAYGPHDLCYHKSWDWLMPVVEKIESMGYCARIVRSGGERCVIYDPEIHNSADVYMGKGFGVSVNQEKKIDAVYNAVVEFIQYYNQQKK